MKKFVAVVFAAVMVMSVTTSAFASAVEPNDGCRTWTCKKKQ